MERAPTRPTAPLRRRYWEARLRVVGANAPGAGPLHDRAGSRQRSTSTPASASTTSCAFWWQAGLSPLEALQATTLNPIQFLSVADSLGTLEAGKLADIVLLDADPLTDIRNTNKIRAVASNRAPLDAKRPR